MNWRYLKGAFALLVVLTACGESNDGPVGDPVPVCEAGNTICDRACVDTLIDTRNCGACGNTCDAGEICSAGQCATSCPEEQTECDGACHDLDTSAANCGTCGNACEAGQFCSDGVCGTQCPDGQTECDGGCHDLEASAAHCGACGTTCAAGESCSDGACVTACPAGQEACDGGCYNFATSRQNCGECGTTCGDGEACIDGVCGIVCGAGEMECDGICRDISTDRNNCGGCGTACGGGELCVDGSCDLHCATGLSECDGTCRDTDNDRNNCGACGTACGQGELCVAGTCTLTCGDFASEICDGACTNTDLDPANCGACGNACAAGEMCSNGACASDCGTTLAVCGGGCTDVLHDPANCGTCDAACPALPGTTPVCADGGCASICYFGQADCDRDLATSNSNGCETEVFSDMANCGGCGLACPSIPNAAGACIQGSCAVGTCSAGFEDCDFDPSNGCEASLADDRANCGACGNACSAGLSCISGVCTPMFGDDCSNPLVLTAGTNTLAWEASERNFITSTPSCASGYAPTGPDIVLRYDATANGNVDLSFTKPEDTRWHVVISDGACGTLAPQVACISDWDPPVLTGSFPVRAGTSYFLYVVDSTSGTLPLSKPLILDVTENLCTAASPTPVPTSQVPAPASTATSIYSEISATFDLPIDQATGTIQVTGNMGTNHSIPLPSPQVTFSADGLTIDILPGALFQSGESITVSLTGLVGASCGNPVTPLSWSFTTPVVPCVPGTGGMVGASVTRVPSGLVGSALTESYVAADTDPNGYVYYGGTGVLYRTPKAGGMPEDILAAAGLTTSHLGYAVLIDGNDIYTADSKTTGTDGHLYRISSDGGVTWNIEDVATFNSAPNDDIHSLAAYGGRIYMLTHEATSTVDTQIWSIDANTSAPVTTVNVTNDLSFSGYTYCSGLAIDGTYFYTACRVGSSGTTYAVLRIEKSTGTITELTTDFPGNTTQMAIHAKDADGDGLMDFVYFNEDVEEGYAVCSPHGTPYADRLYTFGTATGNYGLGFDPVANVLWAWDDDTMELIKIH